MNETKDKTLQEEIMPKKKVLFFTATSGAGQNAVTAEVKAKFDEHGFETKTIDLFAHDEKITKMLSGFRFKARFWFPRLANFFWRLAKRKQNGKYDRFIKKIKDIIIPQVNEFGPDIIVSAHAAGQMLLHWYGNEITKPFRDYTILTDYEIPPAMKPLHSKQSFIVVPTIDFKKELEGKGYSSEQILPFGIPINEKYYKVLFRIDVLPKLDLPNFDKEAPTVLMMGGGSGLGKIAGIVKTISRNPEIQIISVCGRNEELKRKIDKIIAKNARNKKPHARIYNYGFCVNVEELMTVSHFFVGKTGGVSATEAIAKGLQVVSFKNIPFPELANLRYLESKCLAKCVKRIEQLEYYVALKPERRAMKNVLVEYSADKILNHVLKS